MDNLNNLYYEYEQLLIGNNKRLSSVYFSQADSPGVAKSSVLALTKYLIEDILKLDEVSAKLVLTRELLDQFHLLFYIDKYIEATSVIPPEEKINFIVNCCYHTEPRDNISYVIQTYSKLIHNQVSMPKSFFKSGPGLINASVCLQYAIEEFMVRDGYNHYFTDIPSLYYFFNNDKHVLPYKYKELWDVYKEKYPNVSLQAFLKESRLYDPSKLFYNSPLDFLHNSLSKNQKNTFLYNYLKFEKVYCKKQKEVKRKKKKEQLPNYFLEEIKDE